MQVWTAFLPRLCKSSAATSTDKTANSAQICYTSFCWSMAVLHCVHDAARVSYSMRAWSVTCSRTKCYSLQVAWADNGLVPVGTVRTQEWLSFILWQLASYTQTKAGTLWKMNFTMLWFQKCLIYCNFKTDRVFECDGMLNTGKDCVTKFAERSCFMY